jgi:hypothetical protein
VKETEVELPPDSLLVDVRGVIQMCAPLGRDQVEAKIIKDPEFPPPAFGGSGAGSKRVWVREQAAAAARTILLKLAAARQHNKQVEGVAA